MSYSYWLWSGYDKEDNRNLYVLGDSATDLYFHLLTQGLFGDRDPYLDKQLNLKGITLSDVRELIQPGENWNEGIERAGLHSLRTRDIVDIILKQMEDRYQPVKLLEIAPDPEIVMDYSHDRDLSFDDQLESSQETWYTAIIIDNNEKQVIRVQGPDTLRCELQETLMKSGRFDPIWDQELHFSIRYLHKGQKKQFIRNDMALFIEAEQD